MRDVIVIGARCAGASTAMLLARKGYDVLLVDRARFPSDIAHGHLIHRQGPRRLSRWGLLDRIVATGSPPIQCVVNDFGDYAMHADDLQVDGVALAIAPRRTAVDSVLVQAAVEAGAELREEFTVDGLIEDNGRITGIRGRDKYSGGVFREHATLVVGADGRGSLVARRVQAPSYDAVPPLTFSYFSYWSGIEKTSLEIYVRPDHVIFAFPTNDGLCGIFIAWPLVSMPAVRSNVAAHFMAAIDRIPEFAARVRNGQREERFYAALDLPNFLRKPHGPGWALVGDSGCHKDPFLALGMSDGLRDAELLTDAIDDALSNRQPMEAALAQYESKRNAATLPDYKRNIHLAGFNPISEEIVRVRAAVREDPGLRRQFTLANMEAVPRETFFNEKNIQRLLQPHNV